MPGLDEMIVDLLLFSTSERDSSAWSWYAHMLVEKTIDVIIYSSCEPGIFPVND